MKEKVPCLKSENSLLLNNEIIPLLKKGQASIQNIAASCLKKEIHIPCMLEAINYFHGIKTANSSTNLIQAQRDYFGAHTYKKIVGTSEKSYHTKWL